MFKKIFEGLEYCGYKLQDIIIKEKFQELVIVLNRVASLSEVSNSYVYDQIVVAPMYMQTKSMIVVYNEQIDEGKIIMDIQAGVDKNHLIKPTFTLLYKELLNCIYELQQCDFKEVVEWKKSVVID